MRWLCLNAAVLLLGLFGAANLCGAQTVALSTPVDSSSTRPATQKRSSPRSVMLRSLAVPGWGQYYNRQYLKAALAFGAEAGLVVTSIYWSQQANKTSDQDSRLIYIDYRNQARWWLLATVLFSMLDAYVDASLSDFDESPDLSLAPPGNRPAGIMLTIKIGL